MPLKCILIAALTFSRVSAQDVMDTVISINEVIVFSKGPQSEKGLISSEIDSISLSRNLSEDLSSLLSSKSLIYIRSYGYGGLSTASFRGTAANHTKVYWNDMKINDPSAGQVDFSLIPASFADEVKIYHGSSSLQHGSGALGGSVHINSLPEWKDGISSTLFQKSGSFNTHHSFVKVSGGKNNFFIRLRAFRRSSDNNFEYLNTANGLWNTEKLKASSSARKGIQSDMFLKTPDKGIFSLHSWIQSADRNFAPVMSYMGPSRLENQQDQSYRILGKWKYYGGKVISRISTGFSQNELDYYLGLNESFNTIHNSRSNSLNIHTRYEAEADVYTSTKIKGMINMAYVKGKYNDLKNNTGFDVGRPEAGVVLSLHHELNIPLSFYTLLRSDIYGKEQSPLMPAAGVEYSPEALPGIDFKSNISRNYNFPGLNDLYWIPGGNPDLRPEDSYSSDLSVNYELGYDGYSLQTSLTTFLSTINNWILWKPGEYGFWKAENVERVRSRGLEYQLISDLDFGFLSLHIAGTYSYTRTSNEGMNNLEDASAGKQLIYIPVHRSNFNCRLKFRYLELGYGFLASGKRYTTTDNDPFQALSPYMIQELEIAGRFKIAGFTTESGVEIKNLSDTDYQVINSRPMPGRNFTVFFKIDF